ncbi:hypothetical protein BOX15_Mlig029835g1 [Macrostomum lignano]|uniref:Uncharacterized protein n=2 Tax=Macrostomum lignano TaxID=282301 RepID=A0A267GRX6_9PLAT|nr:hypothetical protein BOX15_Mlig029835g1 [Macrostomum lignano]
MQPFGNAEQSHRSALISDREVLLAAKTGDVEVICRYLQSAQNINRQILWNGQTISPLHLASMVGNISIVEIFIRLQVDVDIQSGSGISPLHFASEAGHQKIVELLVKAQADVNIKDEIYCSAPLWVAAQNGHLSVVKELIKSFANVDSQEQKTGCSPLYSSSQNGHLHVVNALIKAKADVNLERCSGASPLYIACENGYYQIVKSLINARANTNLQESVNGSTPLYIAAQNGHHQIVDLLINSKVEVNLQTKRGFSPLCIAAQKGHPQVASSLIKAEADVNQQEIRGVSPLLIASQNGHHKVVALLIKANADVNLQQVTGESPLFLAAQNGHLQVTLELIKAQSDVNLQSVDGCTPIFIASRQGHLRIVDSLIDAQADVNLQEVRGFSSLYVSAENGHLEVVNSLIKAQADVNLQENDGYTPLYVASQNGHDQVVKSLIRANANVNLLEKANGSSPLHIATQGGHLRIVNELIRAGAEINIQEKVEGSTPLYIASQNGYHQIVDSLLKARADIEIQTYNGYSPLHVASKNNHQRVVDLLLKAQSEVNKEMVPDEQGQRCEAHELSFSAASSDQTLSQKLHSALTESGFVESRAKLQMAAADVLQDILRKRLNNDEIFVVGSFSEGWGNNLQCLDGRTDIQSDIDVMTLLSGRLHHQLGFCQCDDATIVKQAYENGHINAPGFASNPALPSYGTALRPALDQVDAARLCCYPTIAPLQQQRISKSHIPKIELCSLQDDVSSNSFSPCHVVNAASPGQGGYELRVSTSFLEKRMLRSLTTLQGQLFVTLKYLVKKVICHADGFKLQGVKPYHVKTITFRMVEETPPEQWKPENLVILVRRALQMLHDSAESNCKPDNAHGRIMEHFFLSDTALYLKGLNRNESEQILSRIVSTLKAVIEKLPQLLVQFIGSLTPINESGRFYFHPFQILPNLTARLTVKSDPLKYEEIYDVVRECLQRLTKDDCSLQSQENLALLISRLPDCAFTTREALKALACIKFGYQKTAERIVSHCRGHSVNRGIVWSAEKPSAAANFDVVWQYLRSHDSTWKFCFQFDERPVFKFLPVTLAALFPLQLMNKPGCFFINSEALMLALNLELRTIGDFQSKIAEVTQREDADDLELLTAAMFASDIHESKLIFNRLVRQSSQIPATIQAVLKRRWNELTELSNNQN